jgi:hypothetical protein
VVVELNVVVRPDPSEVELGVEVTFPPFPGMIAELEGSEDKMDVSVAVTGQTVV